MIRLGMALILVVVTGPAWGQTDVIVGDLYDLGSWGNVGDIYAYSVGTNACNVGNEELLWISDTPEHPVIGQELYRYNDGRFEQVAFGWLKHAFCALSLSFCDPCSPTPCPTLGVGCSDPYGAGLNGSQTNTGPRSDVNAYTGEYPYPFTAPPAEPIIGRRMQAQQAHVDPAQNSGARYFVEAHYVTADDATAGNGENNVSWREVAINPDPAEFALEFIAGEETTRELPAIYAWQDIDSTVEIADVRVPGEGLILLGYQVTQTGTNSWHYEYAMYNMNSDVSAGRFEIPVSTGVTITNAEFFHVPYHSGEPYSTADWSVAVGANSIAWTTTPYTIDADANALRWSRMFNYRFDADAPPTTVTGEVGLFKVTGAVGVTTLGPGDPPTPMITDITCVGAPTDVQISWTNPIVYSQIEVRRAGQLIATVPGDATEFVDDTTQQGQSYNYTVTPFEGPDPLTAVSCFVTVPIFPDFTRGDVNDDGSFDVSDPVFVLASLFVIGSPQPTCEDAADANDDGAFDISDAVYSLFALFVPGSPATPAPLSCSWDPTIDTLDCESVMACP